MRFTKFARKFGPRKNLLTQINGVNIRNNFKKLRKRSPAKRGEANTYPADKFRKIYFAVVKKSTLAKSVVFYYN